MARWLVAPCILLLAVCSTALPADEPEARGFSKNSIPTHTSEDLVDKIYSECLQKDTVSCIKFKLFSYVDKLLSKDSYRLSESVAIVRNPNAPAVGTPDISVAEDGSPRKFDDSQMNTWIASRVQNFLKSHSITMNLGGDDVMGVVNTVGRALNEASDYMGLGEGDEARKKETKMLLPLLIGLKLKAATLIPIALGKLALLAGKALLIAKIALLLSAIIGLKKLFSHQKAVTYEIVSHPHYSHESYGHGGSAYGRSFVETQPQPANWDPQQLVYRGQQQQQNP